MPSRRDWYVAALLIGLGGLFLAGAAAVRWVPCLGDASAGCQARQSRAFDYLVPVEPSQAWPATAVLAGIGLLLVAAVAVWLTGWVGRVLDALVFGLLAPDAEVAPGSGLLTGVVLMICGGGLAALTATAQERQLPSGAARTTLERPTHG